MRTLFLITTFVFLFSSQAFAYKASDTKNYKRYDNNRPSSSNYERSSYKSYQDRDYSPKTKKNYERYSKYSPTKKKKIQKNWNSFKENSKWNTLSDDRKREIRKKILNKRRSR